MMINLINKINFKNINISLITENINNLIEIFKDLKIIWENISKEEYTYKKIEKNILLYKVIYDIIIESNLNEYDEFNKFIQVHNSILLYSYNNVKFYYFYNDNFEKDLEKVIFMLKITICLNKYFIKKDNVERVIIWIPIPKKRDFKFNKINKNNLLKSTEKFEAFTASGLTFGNNPRITIISRYEEIEKLLLHELVHNFRIDGSNNHNELNKTILKYREIKIKNNELVNFDYEYSIYESYSELCGTYLYFLFKNINLNIEFLKDKLLAQIIIELVYSFNTIVNLANLNSHDNYNDFIKKEFFLGEICIYEYYYIKGMMYNSFKFRLCKNKEEFIFLYEDIIDIMSKTKKDKLLKDIFNKKIKQNNYGYLINII